MPKYSNEEYVSFMSRFEETDLDPNQKIILRLCFLYGLKMEEIEIISDVSLSYQQMDFLRMVAIEGVPKDVLVDMAQNPKEMKDRKQAYYREQLPKPVPESGDMGRVITMLQKMQEEQEKAYRKLSALVDMDEGQSNERSICKNRGGSRCFQFLIKKFLPEKSIQSEEEQLIELVADAAFSDEQIQVIIAGYESGLLLSKIRKYADPAKTPQQMERIRQVFCNCSGMKNKPT